MIDHLVVGAGTAGAILGARLSEDPAREVLVLEAGPDYPDQAALPDPLRDGFVSAEDGHDWGLTAALCDDRRGPVARGKVVGGSSQVNDCGAIRAPAADFGAWAGLGLPAWDWERVLPSYRRIETDQQYAGQPYHGADGPVPITRWAREDLVPAMAGLLDAALAAGHPYCADINAPDAAGIGPYPQNRRGRLRMSSNLAYLAPARRRPNLAVRGGAPVDRVVLESGRAVGVESGGEVIRAREVTLCAGAPFSPSLLLRSGIGPADDLGRAGIAAAVDIPGVGANLIDQPGAVIPAIRAPEAHAGEWPRSQLFARLAAFPGHPRDDAFYLCLFAGLDAGRGPSRGVGDATGAAVVNALMVGDMAMTSRGRVTVRGADPGQLPAVDLGFYTADGDLARMRAGYRHAWEIAQHPAFLATVDRFVLVDDDTVADDERLDAMLRQGTFSRLNLLGGCSMGPATDPFAVVDEHCRVRGVEGLRVVDASIVPVPLRAPAALTCMMLGEHAAGWVASGT